MKIMVVPLIYKIMGGFFSQMCLIIKSWFLYHCEQVHYSISYIPVGKTINNIKFFIKKKIIKFKN